MTATIRHPDKFGRGGTAWKVAEPEPTNPLSGACSTWILHQPGVHPMWSWWLMTVVHLRPIEGMPEARKQFEEATHEIIFVACDPEVPAPNPDDIDSVKQLSPPDMVMQVGGLTDEKSSALLAMLVQWTVDGRYPVDADFCSRWQDLITNSVEHLVLGGHTDGSVN